MDRKEKAAALFTEGYNCAQAVLGAFADDVAGVAFETLMCLTAPLGGGVGRSGELCGAANGMAIAYGMLRGNFDHCDSGAKTKFAADTKHMIDDFRKQNGALRCHDLLKLTKYDGGSKKNHCHDMVVGAVEILEKYL